MATKKKRRNPADSTTRNVRAANRRLAVLNERMADRFTDIVTLTARLDALVRRVDALEERPSTAGDQHTT